MSHTPPKEPSSTTARISASPAGDADSLMASDPTSSSKLSESQTLFSGTEDGFLLRTYPDSFPQTTEEISPSFSRRWPSSGFTTAPGECWTADTSVCPADPQSPSDDAGFSSLPDALEVDVPPRFYLSQKAAVGILRRADKRGRELPPPLARALRLLAASPEDAKKMTSTLSAPSKEEAASVATESTLKARPEDTSSPELSPDDRAKAPDQMSPPDMSSLALFDHTPDPVPIPMAESWPTRSPAEGSMPARTEADEAPLSLPRRLTPTETERLQGFPAGRTVLLPERT